MLEYLPHFLWLCLYVGGFWCLVRERRRAANEKTGDETPVQSKPDAIGFYDTNDRSED